jgi:hypothetical protein
MSFRPLAGEQSLVTAMMTAFMGGVPLAWTGLDPASRLEPVCKFREGTLPGTRCVNILPTPAVKIDFARFCNSRLEFRLTQSQLPLWAVEVPEVLEILQNQNDTWLTGSYDVTWMQSYELLSSLGDPVERYLVQIVLKDSNGNINSKTSPMRFFHNATTATLSVLINPTGLWDKLDQRKIINQTISADYVAQTNSRILVRAGYALAVKHQEFFPEDVVEIDITRTLLFNESTSTCGDSVVPVLHRHAIFENMASMPSMDAFLLLLSDGFPRNKSSATFQLRLPRVPAPTEIVTITCSVDAPLSNVAQLSAPSSVAITEKLFSSGLRSLNFSVETRRPLAVGIGPFVGFIKCEVTSHATEPLAYRPELINITVAWIPATWTFFSDLIVKSTGSHRYRSAWDQAGVWHTFPTNRSDLAQFIQSIAQKPNDTDLLSVTASGNASLILVADTAYLKSGRGPYDNHTRVRIGRAFSEVKWVSANGGMIMFDLPPRTAICFRNESLVNGIDSATDECDKVTIGISSNQAVSDIVASLADIAYTPWDLRKENGTVLDSIRDGLNSVQVRVGVSCPPFCPHGNKVNAPGRLLQGSLSMQSYPGILFVEEEESHWVLKNNNTEQLHTSTSTDYVGGGEGLSIANACDVQYMENQASGLCAIPDSGALCAYEKNGTCLPCPSGALCPGGPLILPLPGYWAAGFPRDPNIVKCAPPETRCEGIAAGTQRCAPGYLAASYACSECASGYYKNFDTRTGATVCKRCSFSSAKSYTPALIFVASLLGVGVVVLFLAWVISKKFGGTMGGSAGRCAKLLLFLFTSTQYLVQVGKTTRNIQSIPSILRNVFVALDVLQFSDLSVPPECSASPPFFTDKVIMSIMLGCLAILFIMTIVWRFVGTVVTPVLQKRKPSSHPLSGRTRDLDNTSATMSSTSMTFRRMILTPLFYRRILLLIPAIIFTLVCNTAFNLIPCGDPIQMRVASYLTYRQDGTALRNAGISCDPAGSSCTTPGLQPLPESILKTMITVSLAKKHDRFICDEADHRTAKLFAFGTIAVAIILFPLLWLSAVACGLSRIGHKNSTHSGGCPFRNPCERLKRRSRSGTLDVKQSPRASAVSVSTNNVSLANIIDGRRDLIEADHVLSPFVAREFYPSAFYMVQVGQAVSIALSLALAFFDAPSQSKWRFIINTSILVPAFLLTICSDPYMPEEQYSCHVQLAIFLLALLVSVTDFVGNTSANAGLVQGFAFLSLCAILLIFGFLIIAFFRTLVQSAKTEEEHIIKAVETRMLSECSIGNGSRRAFVFGGAADQLSPTEQSNYAASRRVFHAVDTDRYRGLPYNPRSVRKHLPRSMSSAKRLSSDAQQQQIWMSLV